MGTRRGQTVRPRPGSNRAGDPPRGRDGLAIDAMSSGAAARQGRQTEFKPVHFGLD
jgi:hypothetical protein